MNKIAYGLIGAVMGAAGAAAVGTLGARADVPPERPAYLLVVGEVKDREAFMSGYQAKLGPIYEKFGGEYLVAGRTFEVLEGEAGFKSVVISKWPSMAAGRAFWTSPEYDELRRARIDGAWGAFDVVLIEGLPVAE